jgi:hypothetical protein
MVASLMSFFIFLVLSFKSFLLYYLNGIVYRLNDSVVIQPEYEVQSHSWTWKAKLKNMIFNSF